MAVAQRARSSLVLGAHRRRHSPALPCFSMSLLRAHRAVPVARGRGTPVSAPRNTDPDNIALVDAMNRLGQGTP